MRRSLPTLLFVLFCQWSPGAAFAAPTHVRDVEGVAEYRLPNGLQVLLIPDASKPTTTVNVTYRVGSRMENYGETGMAHLLEHLMFKSSRTMANVGAELSKRGMNFNGTTSDDRTNYYETFPADAASLDWVLKVEAERMTGAKVIKRDLDSEMTVVRNEMESGENNPVQMLIQKTHAAAYQWHNYGKSTIGARSDVENVDISRLQAFYRTWYQPDNATLIVAGAFDPKRALATIDAQFGKLPKPTRRLPPTYTVEPVQDGDRTVTLRRVGGQQALLVSYHMPALTSPDYPAFEIIANTLADTPSGRLHKRLVEKGLATGVFGWADRNAEPGLLSAGAVLRQDGPLAEAEKVLVDTVEGLKTEPITQEELQRTQVQWAKALDQTLADPQALCVALSEAIAAGDWRLLFALRDRLQAVTLDQVNAVAKQWLLSSNRTLGRFIPTEQPERTPLAQRVDPSVTLKDFKPREALSAGEAFDASPQNIDARSRTFTLPSGMKVALLPKKSRGGTVKVALALHIGNLESLQGQRTVADLVGDLLASGTQHKSRAQISDAFDALKTDWSIDSDVLNGATVSLDTRREQLVPALQLLGEILREPAFPKEEFEQRVRQGIGALERSASDPNKVATLALGRAMQPWPLDDPRHRASVAESIDALKAVTLEQVVSFYRQQWGAGHAELSIVGDFDAAEVEPLLRRWLDGWVAAVPYQRVPQPGSKVTGVKLDSPLADKPNAIVYGSLPIALADTDADAPALALATHVLGAGGFDSRLLTRLRQQDGLSYGAGAFIHAGSFEPAGSIGFYAIFAPQNRARVQQAFTEELARFAKDGITAAELVTAKRAMAAGRATRRADDGAIAHGWVDKLELGRTWAFDAEQDAKLQALTLDQVNAAIRRWLAPEKVNWSWAGDFTKQP
jgi:zinc protease